MLKYKKNGLKLLVIAIVIVAGTFLYINRDKNELPEAIGDSPFDLGQYYFNTGLFADGTYDLTKARQFYSKAIESNPSGYNLAWYQLGRIDFIQGRFDEAIYKFKKQIYFFDDEIPNVYYMLGLTYGYKARREGEEGDWLIAEENFKKYIEYDSVAPWPRVDLAWVYFSQGKFEEMIPVLQKGLEYEPYNAWLLNMYGLALLNTGNKEEAHSNFELAAKLAESITTEVWGDIYPGNDPNIWGDGLQEFKSLINKNLELSSN